MSNDQMAFDGKCAFAVSVGGATKAPDANPKYFVAKDGVTYGFLGIVPKVLFQLIPGSAKRADRLWAKLQAA
ncbi:hypothetical protein [Nocardioides jejuensis]|uniref:Uncharacterized protein n=1 Tax=Nocardioides jejuensis TaxID=2502782 RepID=A0A4R1BVH2_9ACTN|nr:hypothetical protein [Nocardioides jejuensis]TCJ21728.1 hypothetical protein EPD65_14380 [Nocardioides jejuensis]